MSPAIAREAETCEAEQIIAQVEGSGTAPVGVCALDSAKGRLWPPKDAHQPRQLCTERLIFGAMESTIDDLPLVRASTLVANGLIKRDAAHDAHPVRRRRRRIPSWRSGEDLQEQWFLGAIRMPEMRPQRTAASFARRQACLRRVRQGEWADLSFAGDAHREALCGDGSPRIARLNGGGRFRVHRPGRKVERRANVELKLRRSILTARRFGVEEFEKRVKDDALPAVPDAVRDLDANVVIEVLSRHAVNVSEAARELEVIPRICGVCCGRGLRWRRRRPRWRSVAWILRSGIFSRR